MGDQRINVQSCHYPSCHTAELNGFWGQILQKRLIYPLKPLSSLKGKQWDTKLKFKSSFNRCFGNSTILQTVPLANVLPERQLKLNQEETAVFEEPVVTAHIWFSVYLGLAEDSSRKFVSIIVLLCHTHEISGELPSSVNQQETTSQ